MDPVRKTLKKLIANPVTRVLGTKTRAPYLHSRLMRALSGYHGYLKRMVERNVEVIEELAKDAQRGLFVDCGVNEGIVLRRYIDRLPGFAFVGFEIQDELVPRARELCPEATITRQAVAAADGPVEIFLPKHFGPNFRGGASIVDGKISEEGLLERRECEGIDFAAFLERARGEDGHDFVVVKMDIEGAEYPILDSLYRRYQEGHGCPIDYLIIEFHPQVLSDAAEHERCLARIEEMNVRVSTWV